MKSLSKFLFLLAAFVIFAPAVAVAQDDEPVKVDTTLVRLNIGVVDPQGRPALNLNGQDFTVFEDGEKQNILKFEPTTAPFSLVLLLDVSGSTKSFRQLMSQSAARFVDALAPEDRVSVVLFNNKAETLVDFTSNRKDILYAIGLVNSQSKGGDTMLYKALDNSLDKLKKEGARRKAVVVLTDGIDTELERDDRRAVGANATTAEAAIAALKPSENSKLVSILDTADRQGVTIYPLALPSGDPKRLPDPLPFQVAKYTAARERLEFLANRTGASFHAINRLEDMGRLYATVAAEIRTLYTVEYESTLDRPRNGKWRTIRLEIKRPDLIAKTRPGYFAK